MDLMTLDNLSFGELIEPHRRELQVHCYRMMGTIHDAEDMVQETLLRAWRKRATYAGRASLRAWLYKIATNVCLDALKKAPHRSIPRTYQAASSTDAPIAEELREPIWLQPYPDELLPDANSDPAVLVTQREHITLAFVTVLHLLPPRQRAVLLLRDVLNWKAIEVADLLDTTVSAVKSALHRARATLELHAGFLEDPVELDEITQTQIDEYVHAWQTADVDGLVQLLTNDATFSMPPIPSWYQGHEEIRRLLSQNMFAGDANGRWRLVPTRANHQIAFGFYRITDDTTLYAAYGIQVLTLREGKIAHIITFRDPKLVGQFGLPEQITV